MFRRDSDEVFRATPLESFSWLRHGFGSRLSLQWPAPKYVNQAELATVQQIHSDRVVLAQSPGPQGQGDALISNQPGIYLAIKTADCLPILIVDPIVRAVAAIHAGWRGVVSEIVPKTILALREQFGSNANDLIVAVGPGIGACCFEVGSEVAEKFCAAVRRLDSGKMKVDLVKTLCGQLGRNGVTQGQITLSKLCTFCDREVFESYRRDGSLAGRMVAMIGIHSNNRQLG